MKRAHIDTKSLNENLNPLRRFLESRVGKPWDKVYSEISQHLKPTSAVQQHVRDHVWDFVKRIVFVQDSGIFHIPKYHGKVLELRNGDLYICPKSGILKKYVIKKKKADKFDPIKRALSDIASNKCIVQFGNEGVYRYYEDPLTNEWSIRERATAIHARIDFNEKFNFLSRSTVRLFFLKFSERIDLKDPYFKTYLELIKNYDDKYKSYIKEKPEPQYLAGARVEVSEDNGETWDVGIINRVEDSKNLSITIWVSVGTKNIRVSPYIPRKRIRFINNGGN